MTRDPRIDPQPGDEVRGGPYMRRITVLEREGGKVLIARGRIHHWMRVDTWQKWCKERGAEAVKAANQDG